MLFVFEINLSEHECFNLWPKEQQEIAVMLEENIDDFRY